MGRRIPTAEEYEQQIRYTKDEIEARLCSLGQEIDRDFPDGVILLVYLRAAAMFGCDLLRKITVDADIDFLSIGRYQVDKNESPLLFLRQDASVSLFRQNVLLCTDIVRSGFTMHFLLQQLQAKKPRSLQICTLLHNEDQQLLPLPLAYIGFNTSYASLCGYGMHFRGQGRQFPDIVELIREDP